jgi:uncharacterized protein (TIGR02588 family)
MSKKQSSLRRERTSFEWVILAVSILAICAIAGGLLFYTFSLEGGPPSLRTTVRPASGGELTLRVTNVGGTTAEEVVVDVRRGKNGSREVIFRAVAKGDYEEATVTLPGSGRPTAEVVAYKEP